MSALFEPVEDNHLRSNIINFSIGPFVKFNSDGQFSPATNKKGGSYKIIRKDTYRIFLTFNNLNKIS